MSPTPASAGTTEALITDNIRQCIAAQQRMLEANVQTISAVVRAFVGSIRSGGKVLLCGNGGSAADAQHVAAELVGRFKMEREALPAIALTTDTSILTSVANDYAFEQVFARQVRALARPGDVVVGISTSGKSPNVVAAIRAAKERGAIAVGFTGQSAGALGELCDLCLCIPSEVTARVQECQITAWHAICDAVEQDLFKSVTD